MLPPSAHVVNFYYKGNRYLSVCSGCETCGDCDVANNTVVPTCTDELENTRSTGDTIVLETLSINDGYWRATPSSRVILACHNADACLGGQTGAADYCAEGYEGPCTSSEGRVLTEVVRCSCYRARLLFTLSENTVTTHASDHFVNLLTLQ